MWPLDEGYLHPKELQPLAAATVEELVAKQHKVLWAAVADGATGQWVSAADARFLPPIDSRLLAHGRPSALLIDVARQAGLLVVDVPAVIYQV